MMIADVKGYHEVYSMIYSKDATIYSGLDGVRHPFHGIVDILCDYLVSVSTCWCDTVDDWLAGRYRIPETSIEWMAAEAATLPEVKMCVAARAGEWEAIKTCVVRLGRRVEGMWDDVMAHAARGGHANIVRVCASKGATDWERAARYARAGDHGELEKYCEGMALAYGTYVGQQ